MRPYVLYFLLIQALLFGGKPKEKSPPVRFLPEQSALVLPDAAGPLAECYARIKHADELCMKEQIRFDRKLVKKNELLLERPLILAGFDPVNSSWHLVHLVVPNPIPESYFRDLRRAKTIEERNKCKIPIRVITQGYEAEHIVGAGPTRLVIRLRYSRSGNSACIDPLIVYRMLYVRIPGKKETNFERAVSRAQYLLYTPGNNDLYSPELATEGERFLREKVRRAMQSLREMKVLSRAFPQQSIGDVVKDEMIISLMVSEQWDPLYFLEDRNGSFRRILAEYGLNREEAFMWSVSSANAVGCLQFTNKNNNGTYAAVVRAYPEAKIEKNFEVGARNMHNVIIAATCLLDLELAHSKKAVALFTKDAILGSIHPIAAYNGGPLAAGRMVSAIERLNGKKLSLLDRAIMKLPNVILPASYHSEESRKREVVVRGIRGNSETPMYIKKYLYLMERLEESKK